MFYDFLKECSAVLEEEMYDYESVLRRFAAVERTYTGLMPSIVEDLYPIYALECTSANRFVKNNMPQVYGRNYYFEKQGDRGSPDVE